MRNQVRTSTAIRTEETRYNLSFEWETEHKLEEMREPYIRLEVL
jgi:hypothetical protein